MTQHTTDITLYLQGFKEITQTKRKISSSGKRKLLKYCVNSEDILIYK
jgi:hypothetical protein